MTRFSIVLAVALVSPALAVAATSAPAPAPAAKAPTTQVDAVFAAWDADHNGSLTRDEFRQGWARLQARMETEQRLRAQFQHLDADHDGNIDAKEYAGVALAKQQGAAAPLSRFDMNYDKRLSFVEYIGLVQALAPRTPATPAPAAAPKGH
ncbi:EF-hand domain-containing protein [Lysobacter claricitrinus]|uniref:EF-hand domain-containing protein n=1 Tax=Lysobacter claricitrinus TaxID=3367728 RepID=UPI0037DAA531